MNNPLQARLISILDLEITIQQCANKIAYDRNLSDEDRHLYKIMSHQYEIKLNNLRKYDRP